MRTLSKWQDHLKNNIETFGDIPYDYIPGCFIECDAKGPAIQKYKTLLEKQNTPFSACASAAPAKRLWNYLVRQDVVQDVFIRIIFTQRSKPKSDTDTTTIRDFQSDEDIQNKNGEVSDAVRIIHKDQESILAFCLNRVNTGLMALATPKELQEIDVSLLLDSPNWLEDECEIDILNLNRDVETLPSSGFLVVQTPSDR